TSWREVCAKTFPEGSAGLFPDHRRLPDETGKIDFCIFARQSQQTQRGHCMTTGTDIQSLKFSSWGIVVVRL
ncbi:MAG: hypothetical protein ACI350_02620, partial [Prevotella sp.]